MAEISNIKMRHSDYPALYKSADKLSLLHQKRYYRYLAGYLSLLILGAVTSFFSTTPCLKVINIIVFACSLFIYILSKILDPQELWYNGRAVAESVKTRTWRWMMRAHPYNKPRGTVSNDFVEDLQIILKENESLFRHYCGDDKDDCESMFTISDKMREIRDLSTREKVAFYNKNRVKEQQRWYKSKAKNKHHLYNVFFGITVGLYAIIIILMIIDTSIPINYPIEVLAVVASSIISWIEAKKYNELSKAYSLAAQDIALIRELDVEGQIGEDQLSNYVIDSENAFSREHTQWFARKR